VAPKVSSLLCVGLATALALTALTGATSAVAHGEQVVHGADISWPNCPKGEGIPSRRTKGEPMPKPSAQFVVVGVTNGPGFYPNPCLANQVSWVVSHQRLLGAYALTTFPGHKEFRRYRTSGPYVGASRHVGLRNVGYAEAAFNVATMASVGLAVPLIWVDVEPYPVAPWSRHHAANRAVISGVIRGYRDKGYQVGLYTYANGWRDVVGSWRLPHLPTWSTVGHLHARKALAACTVGPSGGETWLAQWYDTHRDYDLICPAGADAQIFSST
jgi:hypothetical protein